MRRNAFVTTANVEALLAAVAELDRRGAEEACLIVVDGEPGLGKTHSVQRLSVQSGWVYLRCKKEWTPAWMLRELLETVGITPEYSFEKMFRQAVAALSDRAVQAERDGGTFCLVVDEVDHIARSSRQLETIRDLSDLLELPTILVGMGQVRSALGRFRQIGSRVAKHVQYRPATLDDVRALAQAQCEVEVADDLCAFLHEQSLGYLREAKEGLAHIERFGKRNGGPVTRDSMDGEVLMNDRKTGKPIKVRAA
jgi:DNA transposition AAA+ family ATPase